MLVLGIETSCDETAAAVVEASRWGESPISLKMRMLSNIVASQIDVHSKFGGVVPELASRKHIQNIVPVILQALSCAGITLDEVDGIAVTQGPGLVGSLLVGISVAKALAYTRGLPIVGVNHLEAHIYSNYLEHKDLEPPFISLVVSGGHTELVYVGPGDRQMGKIPHTPGRMGKIPHTPGDYEKLGQTMDDAAGEAFDKVAKLLGLGYPGGPIIDKLSKEGDAEAIPFPRPYVWNHSLNFSFSGLKTAVLNYVLREQEKENTVNPADVAASFQAAVVDVLTEKTLRAAEMKKINVIALGGGVAANSALRKQFTQRCEELGYRLYYPTEAILCTDNAAMIAAMGCSLLSGGEDGDLLLNTDVYKTFHTSSIRDH